MSEEGKDGHHHHHHHHHQHHHHHEEEQQPPAPAPLPLPPQYGTFQGVANYPPRPVIGFPQPVPPPQYYAHGYQAVQGHAVAEGKPVRQQRLPCCGCGLGWFLFIIGFFLVGIPWYVAAFTLLCANIDPREKPGYITCTIAAVLATIALISFLA